MGGTSLNLGGITDAKTSEQRNDGVDNVTFSSVDQFEALQILVQPQMPDPTQTITAPNNNQDSALRSLGPVNALNPNGSNFVNAAAEAADRTRDVGAQLQQINKLSNQGPDQTVAASMTPVQAPAIQAPTMGGSSYSSSSRKKDNTEETMWKPAVVDPVFAAATFTAMPAAVNGGPSTYIGQPLDHNAVKGVSQDLGGVTNTKGIGDRLAETSARNAAISVAAVKALLDAGRETKGPAVAALKFDTPKTPAPASVA